MHDLVDVLSCTQCWYHDSWLDQLLRSFLFPNFFLRKRTLVDSNFFPTCSGRSGSTRRARSSGGGTRARTSPSASAPGRASGSGSRCRRWSCPWCTCTSASSSGGRRGWSRRPSSSSGSSSRRQARRRRTACRHRLGSCTEYWRWVMASPGHGLAAWSFRAWS